MSSDAVSNVVPLRAGDRPGPSPHAQQFEQLLRECRDLTCERLCESLTTMLNKSGDTLWEMTSAAQDRETQRLYMDAKDKLLPQRKAMEDGFRSRYLMEFDERAGRATREKQSFSDFTDTSLELGLVAEDDLNETLRVNDLATKVRRYCEEELSALDQRVGVLLGDANLQADDSPFSPQAVCDAFKLACRDIQQDVKIRMVFVKLFDDHVLDDIRSIYKAVNALLVQNSILPKIRYGVSRTQEGAGGSASDATPGAQGGAAPGPGAAPAGDQDMFSMLQNMLAANAKAVAPLGAAGVPQAGAGMPAQAPVEIAGFPPIMAPGLAEGMMTQTLLQGAALLSSLTRIQQGDLNNLNLGGGALQLPATAAEAGTTNVLREIKGSTVGTGMGQMDIATLDIVAMLFDQIFEDSNIPDGMKWLIGRLQIPMLKVAILDKNFFSSRTHPARQLLDSMGEVAVGLPLEFDASNPLYGRVDAIVQKLIDGFQDSLEIFDTVRQDLLNLVAEDDRRVEEETRSATKRLEQKERLSVAKAIAQEEVRTRVRATPMPKAIMKFLVQQWVKLLLMTHAKRGKEGDAWKSALETMDQLIWSAGPKASTDERRKLAAMLPGLLKRLAAGMQIIGTNEATRTRFFAELLKLHTEALGGPLTRNAPQPAEPAAAASQAKSDSAVMKQPTGPAADAAQVKGDPGVMKQPTGPAAAAAQVKGDSGVTKQAAGPAAATAQAKGDDSAVMKQPAGPAAAAAQTKDDSAVTKQPAGPAAAPAPAKGDSAVTKPPAGPAAAPTQAKGDSAAAKQSAGEAPKASSRSAAQPPAAAAPAAEESANESVSLDFSTSTPSQAKSGSAVAKQPAGAASQASSASAAQVPAAEDSGGEPTDAESVSLDFTSVTVKNPFGEGEVQVDEIELPSIPGAPAVAVKDGDKFSKLASSLKPGTWLEFRKGKKRHQVKLSYISPFKSAYLFVNRAGQTVGEYALWELAAELRSGHAVVMEEVPLFDRAMTNLMSALRTDL